VYDHRTERIQRTIRVAQILIRAKHLSHRTLQQCTTMLFAQAWANGSELVKTDRFIASSVIMQVARISAE
jgi:hypothetical protein